MPKLTQEKMIRLRAHKPPAQREFSPKRTDPGMRITWTRVTPGRWTIPATEWRDVPGGTWIPATTRDMTGVIWSDGPEANSVWARCADGEMAALKMPVRRNALLAAALSPSEMTAYGDTWWRLAIRRAENVRSFGSVFAAVDGDLPAPGWCNGARRTMEIVTWHCDPSCPDAAGKPRSDTAGYYGYGLHNVVDRLVGRVKSNGTEPLCQRCIYLNEPAESLAAAA